MYERRSKGNGDFISLIKQHSTTFTIFGTLESKDDTGCPAGAISSNFNQICMQVCKIQKNRCTVAVAPTIEHHGRHSRTPVNQR